MEALSQELIDRIVFYLKCQNGESQFARIQLVDAPSNLPPLATISRPFQSAVESITFRTLQLKSTDLDHFRATVTHNRRAKVHRIDYTTVLPTYSTYSNEACAHYETIEEQDTNNESFSQSLKQLFDILKSWEDDRVQGTIRLHVSTIYSPADFGYRDLEQQKKDEVDRFIGSRIDLLDKRYNGSFIRLLRPESLPLLNRVTSLFMGRSFGQRGRRPAPCTAVHITAQLPLLEWTSWDLDDLDSIGDYEGDAESFDSLDSVSPYEYKTDFRAENRYALAKTLNSYRFSKGKDVRIELYHDFLSNQMNTLPSLQPAGATFDPLSAALRRFSQTLTSLYLEATVDSTLFWPSPQENAELPSWPSLKKYVLAFDMGSPAGQWYFTGIIPQESSLEDSHCFYRTRPNTLVIEPLLLAFGKAAQKMPVLEVATITCPLSDDVDGHSQFEVSYHAPGTPVQYGDDAATDVQFRRMYYEVGDWRPNEEVARAMRMIGGDTHGGHAIERFLASQY